MQDVIHCRGFRVENVIVGGFVEQNTIVGRFYYRT